MRYNNGGCQVHLRESGIDQWQNNYPNEEIVQEDIARGNNYILVEDGKVIGTVVLSFAEEESYKQIYDGQWLCGLAYAVIPGLQWPGISWERGMAASF